MAADGLIRCVFEGCISTYDMEIERRPYHRNCSCALHKSNNQQLCSKPFNRNSKISYPVRRSWSEGCLAMAASSSSSPPYSPSSCPLKEKTQLAPSKEEDGISWEI